MLIGALLDAGLDFKQFKSELGKLNLTNYDLQFEKVSKSHISATKFNVIDKEQGAYRHLKDLNQVVEASDLDENIKITAKEIFLKIGQAEAKIHNQPLDKVHFHEISGVDTIIDVVGALIGLRLLGVEKIMASKLNVGSGFVEFSHGKFPVPAPATAEILKGTPIYSTDIEAEMVTPTGAAIITTISENFGEMPEIQVERIGYGAGRRDLSQPNVLRVFIGETTDASGFDRDTIIIMETNIDDMNPQLYDHLMESLLENGALDVYLTNIAMKKNRPAVQLTVLARPEDEEKLSRIIFKETTSIGLRIRKEKRRKLQREIKKINTRFGKVAFKISKLGDEILNMAPEYDDCKRIAREKKIPLKEVQRYLIAEMSR